MLVYDRSLAVIPFKVDGTTLDLDDDHSYAAHTRTVSFSLPLTRTLGHSPLRACDGSIGCL